MSQLQPKPFHYSLVSKVVLGIYLICGMTVVAHSILLYFPTYRDATTWTTPYTGLIFIPFLFSLTTLPFEFFRKRNVFPGIMLYMALILPFTLTAMYPSDFDHAPGRAWFTVGLPVFWIVIMGLCWYLEAVRAAMSQYHEQQKDNSPQQHMA